MEDRDRDRPTEGQQARILSLRLPARLAPSLSELPEKLFANQLAYLANVEPDLLESSQIGGRKQRSAVGSGLLLQHYIERHHRDFP